MGKKSKKMAKKPMAPVEPKGVSQPSPVKASANKKKKQKKTKDSTPSQQENNDSKDLDAFLNEWSDSEDEEEPMEVQEDQEDPSENKKNKDYVKNLSKKDPELYKFLQEQNDQELLNLDDSSSEDEEETGGKVHKVPDQLEVGSDESDFEDDAPSSSRPGKSGARQKLSHKMLNSWQENLSSNPTVKGITDLSSAFQAALHSIGGKDSDASEDHLSDKFRVEGGTMFNAVVRLCLTHMEPSLRTVLKLDADQDLKVKQLQRSNKWKPLNRTLKTYTLNLAKLLGAVSEASVLSVLLKHIHVLVPYYAALPKSSKHLLQHLITLWSTLEEQVRILAFLCIIKLTRQLQSTLYEPVIKQMYLAYVKNAKFTSPTTWPMIHFMRRSLAELFALDQKAAYNHAFIYIRQLGINLRNALTTGKKEQIQSVYNWQFVHSAHLWVHLLGQTSGNKILEPLVYPLIQVITGAIKLVYTMKYYPLRFHLCSMLTQLSKETGKHIPVLPYYLEILEQTNFNKKTSKVSMRPVDFSCILKLSKAQVQENGSFDATIEQIYRGTIEYLESQAEKISFPEMVVPALVQIKEFIKKSKRANFSKKMKTLVDQMTENSQFILKNRRLVTFNVTDAEKITTWEAGIRSEGKAPIIRFYKSWKGVKETKVLKAVTKNDAIDKVLDFIPKMKKKSEGKKDKKEIKGIFGGEDDSEEDSESEVSDSERFELKEDRGKKRAIAEESTKKSKKAKLEEEIDDDDNDEESAEEESDDEDMEDEVGDLKLEDIETDEDEQDGGEESEEDDDEDDSE